MYIPSLPPCFLPQSVPSIITIKKLVPFLSSFCMLSTFYSRIKFMKDKREKRVSNVTILCVEYVQRVMRLKGQLFNNHIQICYSIQASPSKYTGRCGNHCHSKRVTLQTHLTHGIGAFHTLFFLLSCTLDVRRTSVKLQVCDCDLDELSLCSTSDTNLSLVGSHPPWMSSTMFVELVDDSMCTRHREAAIRHSWERFSGSLGKGGKRHASTVLGYDCRGFSVAPVDMK